MLKSNLNIVSFRVLNQLWVLVILAGVTACKPEVKELPVIGNRTGMDGTVIEHSIRDFQFVNQLGDTITNSELDGKIYMTDFFFLSCPSICPKVKKQMLRIYDKIEDIDDVMLVSHTIDPVRDDVQALRTYADNIKVSHDKWWFLTGNKEELWDISDDYFIAAFEDPSAPGGFDHSGKIVLIDKQGRLRGFCEGTEAESVDGLMKDLDVLLNEYQNIE